MIRIAAGALALAVCAAVAAAPGDARAQSSGPVTIVVGFGAGGLYHNTGMLLSRHMGKYLPGNPNVVVKTMPGAGSLIAANHLANVAPKDGSVLGVIGGGTILEPLFGNEKARFDPREIHWIGSLSTAVNLCTVWHESPVETIDDATRHEVVAGSTGRGSRTYTYPTALNNTLGTKFKVIAGYQGLAELHPAMERGEVHSVCGWGWDGVMAQRPDWVRDGKVRFLTQFAQRKHPKLPEVPLVLDLMKTERDRQAMNLLVLDTLVAWPLVAPPGMPESDVAALREAYEKTLADPEFVADATKNRRSIELITGAEIEKAIAEVYETPKDVVQYAREISGLD